MHQTSKKRVKGGTKLLPNVDIDIEGKSIEIVRIETAEAMKKEGKEKVTKLNEMDKERDHKLMGTDTNIIRKEMKEMDKQLKRRGMEKAPIDTPGNFLPPSGEGNKHSNCQSLAPLGHSDLADSVKQDIPDTSAWTPPNGPNINQMGGQLGGHSTIELYSNVREYNTYNYAGAKVLLKTKLNINKWESYLKRNQNQPERLEQYS